MSTDNPHDNPFRSVTDKIRSWFERTPRAQRAYEKLSADLDTVVTKVESIVDENDTLRDLRTKVGAAIDPPTTRPDAAVDATSTAPTVEGETSPPPPPASSLPASSTVEAPTPSPAGPPAPSTVDPTPDIEARHLPGG